MAYTFEIGLLDQSSPVFDEINQLQQVTMADHQVENNQLLVDYMDMRPHYSLVRANNGDAVGSTLFLPAENVEQATSMDELRDELNRRNIQYSDILIPTAMDVLPDHRGNNLLAQMLAGSVTYAKSLGRAYLLNFTSTTQEISDYATTQVKNLVEVGINGPDGRPMLLVSLDDLGLML